VPAINDAQVFSNVRFLHGENGVLVDRTSSADFATRTVCAQVSSLSPFVLALLAPSAPQAITGRVTTSTGAPLADVRLIVTNPDTLAPLTTTTTDTNGNYTLALAPGGDYTITATRANFTFTPAAFTFRNLSASQRADFTAAGSITISGRIIRPDGSGIGNVAVTLSGSVTRTTTTLPDGSFLFTNLPLNGDYVVQAESSQLSFDPPRVERRDLNTSFIDIRLAAAPLATPVPTPPIIDDFNGAAIDVTKFTEGVLTQPPGSRDELVTVVQQNGKLVITPRAGIDQASFNGYTTVRAVEFTNAEASVEVNQTTDNGAQTIFAIGRDERNFFRFVTQDEDTGTVSAAAQRSDGTARPRQEGGRRLIFQAVGSGALDGRADEHRLRPGGSIASGASATMRRRG
jgi:hypothetical protein